MDVRFLFYQSRKLISGKSAQEMPVDFHNNPPDYPSYELFTDTLRKGVFHPTAQGDFHLSSGDDSPESQGNTGTWKGRQLRLVVDRNRRVNEVIKM
jgi:hypothetical protein